MQGGEDRQSTQVPCSLTITLRAYQADNPLALGRFDVASCTPREHLDRRRVCRAAAVIANGAGRRFRLFTDRALVKQANRRDVGYLCAGLARCWRTAGVCRRLLRSSGTIAGEAICAVLSGISCKQQLSQRLDGGTATRQILAISGGDVCWRFSFSTALRLKYDASLVCLTTWQVAFFVMDPCNSGVVFMGLICYVNATPNPIPVPPKQPN